MPKYSIKGEGNFQFWFSPKKHHKRLCETKVYDPFIIHDTVAGAKGGKR